MTNTHNFRMAQAAQHLLALHDPHASPNDIREALTWFDASPQNQVAFESVQRFWQACDAVDDSAQLLVAAEPRPRFASNDIGKFIGFAATIIGLLLITIQLILGSSRWDWLAPSKREIAFQGHYSSGIGQIQKFTLPDGSQVTLGAASSIDIEYRDHIRRVSLFGGDALFNVAKDATKPFVVETTFGSVTATGTEFAVTRGLQNTTVSLLNGSVAVSARKTRDTAVHLTSGMQVTIVRGKPIGPPILVDTTRMANWRFGILRFENARLPDVVNEMNRYLPIPITLGSPDLAEVEISGTMRIETFRSWLDGLAAAVGLDIDDQGNRIIIRTKVSRHVVDTPAAQLTI